ncbi:MAG TPA: baseplate J/gp47 family protein, partial [Burkholderiales bacterium]
LAQAQALAQFFLGTHPDQATSAPAGDADVDTDVDHLLLQQELNPDTGTVNGRDPHARQVLRLLPRDAGLPRAEVVEDPVAGRFLVRVRWLPEDRLARRYCFSTRCDGTRLYDLAKFCANLVGVTHGRPWRTVFRAPGSPLAGLNQSGLRGSDEAWYEGTGKWGVLCPLTQAPLAYMDTPPGGERATRSSLQVAVAGIATPWEEVSDLIESRGDAAQFVVETDELSRSSLRFGNGVNGRALPEGAVVTCDYRVGPGVAGPVGCDSLVSFDRALAPAVSAVWNPLDVTGGREPEPAAEILRRVPEAYRQRQLRAVTLEDYALRAEELPEVAHARAAYAWTGSWRTVRVAIDPAGTTELTATAAQGIAGHLDAVRLIGEDLEIRPASPVPLDIAVSLCAHPAYWPEDLRAILEAEFSDDYTPDGRPGFFHPDRWTFGQALHASQIMGRALAVTGVERVLSVSMRRWNPGTGGATSVVTIQPEDLPKSAATRLEMGPFEILRVANDPSHLEGGRIVFDIQGGRR